MQVQNRRRSLVILPFHCGKSSREAVEMLTKIYIRESRERRCDWFNWKETQIFFSDIILSL